VPGVKEFHRFTPPLPRDHVHTGADSCDICEELRGTHRGDQTVSRRQSWSTRLVAESLRDLARGATYAAVSVRARETTGRTRTRAGAGTGKATGGQADARNSWHIAADWTEMFSPVLWEHVEAQMRDRNATEVAERDRLRAEGLPDEHPLTIVIDETAVWSRYVDSERRRASRRDYSVLTVAEVRWRDRGGRFERIQNLRLARALPANDHLAWKLVFDELGYTPSFIVTDSDDGQLKAIREHYAGDPHPPAVVPSMFHVRHSVQEGLEKSPGAFVQLVPLGIREFRVEISDHVAQLSRKNLTALTPAEWSQWWDDLEALLVQFGAPVEPTRKRRMEYEKPVAAVLPLLATYPNLPLSTGGIEVAMRQRIDPILDSRGHAFANLERTNRLLDLVICDDHGLFNKMADVIDLLRSDSIANQGWSTPLRTVSDPQPATATRWEGRYSSLRDQMLLRDVARSKGVS
jgi:hypothetical protein